LFMMPHVSLRWFYSNATCVYTLHVKRIHSTSCLTSGKFPGTLASQRASLSC
jgi:hypothetical protein